MLSVCIISGVSELCWCCVLSLHRRAALEMWKQKNGDSATYNNLIGVFQRAGHEDYAATVRHIGE